MKLEDIMKLLDAGYTKAEISAFETAGQQESKNEPSQKPEDEKPKSDSPKTDDKPADPVITKLDALINAIQLSNIVGTGTEGGQKATAEEVVKKLFEIKKEV